MTLLVTHPGCINHETGRYHPECPERLLSILRALDGEAFRSLDRREAPLAEPAQLMRVHSQAHVDRILAAIPTRGLEAIDADTILSPGSGEAALRAAGAVVLAVDAVASGQANNAFCAVRPPGHHAEPGQAMGFCLFNNVAVGALHARAQHGLHRIAVMDFDVHHGNGTEAMFCNDPGLLYVSTHQWPLYPGTGAADMRGAHGNVLNIPLPEGTASAAFRAAMAERVLPEIEAFQPDLLMISAGFDAHQNDPLGGLQLTEEDFTWSTQELCATAARVCGARVVSVLEGGYNIDALVASTVAHVLALMEA